ncbi:SlyX protein [Comamonas sp. BIGb0152]|uniref:SlyX family protein n=1 Tax=Comamonas sp. BIGb0152 TaxID=2940601 RepID=UPI002167CF46|nr:SlyX family protein [Comamonas sp. BIGb0152]MCS4291864.1 SlyX protein [Comamonas sp. BIGb0152]
MSTLEPLQQRLEALEIKAAYADDLLEELNLTIYKQQQQIDRLLHLVKDLQQRMPEGGGVASGARDELPPHY